MTRTIRQLALAALVIVALPLASANAEPVPQKDLTKSFLDAGVAVDQLRAIDVGGILIIRGRTADSTAALAATDFAHSLGYSRVANLVQIADVIDDAKIERAAERQLAINRSLDGCHITVDSHQGVVTIAGRVQHELQKDVAVALVRNINGVRSVTESLGRD